jgi:hypothetical protein
MSLAALASFVAAGCGKSNLATTTTGSTPVVSVARAPTTRAPKTPSARAPTTRAPKTPSARAPKVPHTPAVQLPLALTPARAAAFARAVQLTRADVPGAHETSRSGTPAAREREAARCGGSAAPTIGGARSPELERGHGLERETIASSVAVLHDAHSVERDLAYSATAAGLKCYRRVLTRSLQAEADPNIKLLGVAVAPLHVSLVGAGQAQGIRILARVAVPGAGVVVRLFVDAITLPYGPAELDLFGTSFVQPVAVRTEEELLTLLHQRAVGHRL